MRSGAGGWATTDPVMALLHDRTRGGGSGIVTAGTSGAEPKAYPRMPRLTLPSPRPLLAPLGAALAGRRSALKLDATAAIPLDLLSQLLCWSVGDSGRLTAVGGPARVHPSAGARYPLEVYVVARLVTDVPPGVYHWHTPTGSLERLPVAGSTSAAVYECLNHPWHRESAAILVVTARRLLEKYGSRGYRFALLEAGAVLQNLALVAAALGLAGSPIGRAWDDDIERLLLLDAEHEVALTAFAVGWPATEPERPLDILRARASAHDSLFQRDRETPVRPAAIVPVDALDTLPLWSAEAPPAVSALRAAETVLGVRLGVECPHDLMRLPEAAWPVYPRLLRLRECGLRAEWRKTPNEADEPAVHGFSVTIASARGGAGSDGFCAARAFEKAIGEAVERYLLNEHQLGRDAIVSPASALDGDAIALDSIAGYSADLRARDPGRFAWTRETPFRWVRGASLATGGLRWVPLQMVGRVSGRTAEGVRWREPELRPRVSTGLAAHPDRTAAVLNALLEVIERDAFMLTWLARLPARVFALDDATDVRIADLSSRFRAAGLEPWAVGLTTDAPVPVVLGMIHDPTGVGPDVAVGAAARPREADAVVAALTEAYATWRSVRRLVGDHETSPTDLGRMRREERLAWWAEPGRWDSLRWLIEGVRVEVKGDGEQCDSPARELDRLVAWLRASGEEAVVVDLTDDALAYQLGHHVVRVIAPGLHPLHLDEARPALWSRRLHDVPVAHGLPRPVVLNALPHPFP